MSEQINVTERLIENCRQEHEELLSGLDNETSWSKEADLGYGNQVVSAAHEQRTVLELIQNARDAIIKGDGQGRVSVIVGPDSLIVANTGIPFRLDQEKVFRAVTSLGRSAKAQDRGSIGEKGVGLKSVLQLSEQFSIYSQVSSQQLSAHFSRARTARMVLLTYGSLLDNLPFQERIDHAGDEGLISIYQSLIESIDGDRIPEYLDYDSITRSLLDADEEPPNPTTILSDLPRISLFRYPFPDSGTSTDSLLASRLVGRQASDSSINTSADAELQSWLDRQSGSFTTAVELEYVDTEWRDLLDNIDESLEEIDHEALSTFRDHRSSTTADEESAARQEQLWDECTGISPETLILLGHIEELDLLRVTRQSDGSFQLAEHRHIRIEQGKETEVSTSPKISRRPVDYTMETVGGGSTTEGTEEVDPTRRFRQYTRRLGELTTSEESEGSEGSEELQLLFEQPSVNDQVTPSDREWKPTSKPLYLYYPIDEVHTPFPFVIHAPFRVGFDRQSLADDKQNQDLLEILPEFVGRVATDLAAPVSATNSSNTESMAQWMPWLVTPLESTVTTNSDIVSAAIEETLDHLQQKAIVPTDDGELQTPINVLCDPQRLYAYEPLRQQATNAPIPSEQVTENGHHWKGSRVGSEDESTVKFQHCASRIGLTTVFNRLFDQNENQRGCIDILCEYWGVDGEKDEPINWAVTVDNVQHAKQYFESVCAVLRSASDEEELDIDDESPIKEAAKQLGEKQVPLLPAEAHQEYGDDSTLTITHLVRARGRRSGSGGRGASRSERIVFRRTAGEQSKQSIISELPTPPSELPVFVIPYRSEWTAPLEAFNIEWGTRKLDSPAEFYQRVGAEAGGYSGDATADPAIVGYIANLYETVTLGQLADWLHPKPHYHHQQETLQETLAGGKTDRLPSDYDDYLERRYVQRIRLPVKTDETQYVATSGTTDPSAEPNSDEIGRVTHPAEELSFGAAWAEIFTSVAESLETTTDVGDRFGRADTDQTTRADLFRRWAAAIRLASRSATETGTEIAPPDDEYWTTVFGDPDAEGTPSWQQRVDTLIHLGVQIGPRIEWRWVLPTRGERDRTAGTLTVETARSLAEGEVPSAGDFQPPQSLIDRYRDVIWRSDHNPAFRATHSTGCQNNWLTPDIHDHIAGHSRGAMLPMWWYFPDLPDADSEAAEPYRNAVLLMWPELSDRIAEVPWLCSDWHSFSTTSDANLIPSLGLVQLAHNSLWPAEGMFEEDPSDDRITVRDGEWLPARHLLLHTNEQVRGAIQYLPRVDIDQIEHSLNAAVDSDMVETEVIDIQAALRAMGITQLTNLTPPMAAERLRWFLSRFEATDSRNKNRMLASDSKDRTFPITTSWTTQAMSVPTMALLRRLVADDVLSRRLDEQKQKRRWIRRDLYHLGTCVPVTDGTESKGLYIGQDWPPQRDDEAVIFTQPLSKYSRDQLVSDSRCFVERPADTTEIAYALSDTDDTANFGIIAQKEPPSPQPITADGIDAEQDRLDTLRSQLKQRKEYLLASYLEQASAPDLQSVHDTLTAVCENTIGIVKRTDTDDTQRNSAAWNPPSTDPQPHIALFQDAVTRYQTDSGAIPPYLAADGLVQVIEQFDLQDTFENVLFKTEAALEDEYSEALTDVRREINELRTRQLAEVHRTLNGLASAVSSGVSLPPPDDFDVDPQTTLAVAQAMEDDLTGAEDNQLLTAWTDRLETSCGLDTNVVAACLVAAATDDQETRHRIVYRLGRDDTLDIEDLAEKGHRWSELQTWPESNELQRVKSYSTAVDLVCRFWDALSSHQDAGEEGIKRAVKDSVETSSTPPPHHRVRSFIGDSSLDSRLQGLRLGDLPYLSDPPGTEQFVEAVTTYVKEQRAALQESDVVYTEDDIDAFLDELEDAVKTPKTAEEAVRAVIETYRPRQRQSSAGSSRTREGLTSDWINDDDTVGELAGDSASPTALSDGDAPGIGDGTGGGYSHVNAEIDARGREGELICLDRAWMRFLAAPSHVRSMILDTVHTWRATDSWRLQSIDDCLDSVSAAILDKTAYEDSFELEELLRAKKCEDTPERKAVFQALFDTAAERGPGFDLIDPFAAMPSTAELAEWEESWMRRVEAKAVDSDRIDNGRIKLTGNELRMALRSGPADAKIGTETPSYLIRLVAFPTDWRSDGDVSDTASVKLLDIEDLNKFLGIEGKSPDILEKLRGGSFYITFEA